MKTKIWIDLEFVGKEFTLTDATLLGLIDKLDEENGNNGCQATNKMLGDLLGLSESKISELVQKLHRIKIIEKQTYLGRERVLKRIVEWEDIGACLQNVPQAKLFSKTTPASEENLKGKDKHMAENVKSNIIRVVSDPEVISALCKWVEVLYSLGKGITTTQLFMAVEDLKKITGDSAELAVGIIKTATQNGWRDFKYCVDTDSKGNPKFTKEQWDTLWQNNGGAVNSSSVKENSEISTFRNVQNVAPTGQRKRF